MKHALILVFGLSCSFSKAQQLFNPFFSPMHFGQNGMSRNILQINTSLDEANSIYNLQYLRTSKSEKWQYGMQLGVNQYSHMFGSAQDNSVLLSLRRRIFKLGERTLFLTLTVGSQQGSKMEPKIYGNVIPALNINYEGKHIEAGINLTKYVGYYRQSNTNKYNWYSTNDHFFYAGYLANIKEMKLRSRISAHQWDDSPLFSQQLYLKSGLNLGYSIGFVQAFNLSVGYKKDRFEANVTAGNHNHEGFPYATNTPSLDAGFRFNF